LEWTKDTLTNVHTYLGFVMIGLVAIHPVIGFKSMLVILKSAFKISRTKTIAVLIIPLLLLGVGYQAFSAYAGEEGTEATYNSYYEKSTNSTVYITGTIMKYYTIQELANEFNVSTDALIGKLKAKGIEATPDEKLVEIEYQYNLDREEFKAMLEEIIGELRGESE